MSISFYYFDASALVKVYIREPGSTWVRGLLKAEEDGNPPVRVVLISDLSVVEVTAAFAVLYRTRRIRRKVWDGVFDQFMDDIHWRYYLIGVTREDFLPLRL
jgi:predicted nucleic acid-binding protein